MSIEFIEKLEKLGIKCPYCIDTKLVWKKTTQRSGRNINIEDIIEDRINDRINDRKNNIISFYDIKDKDNFMIYTCNVCSDFTFVCFSKTSNINYKGIPIFYINEDYDKNFLDFINDSEIYTVRFPIIRKLYDKCDKCDKCDMINALY